MPLLLCIRIESRSVLRKVVIIALSRRSGVGLSGIRVLASLSGRLGGGIGRLRAVIVPGLRRLGRSGTGRWSGICRRRRGILRGVGLRLSRVLGLLSGVISCIQRYRARELQHCDERLEVEKSKALQENGAQSTQMSVDIVMSMLSMRFACPCLTVPIQNPSIGLELQSIESEQPLLHACCLMGDGE